MANPLTLGELLRKIVHMGVGGIAFLVGYLGPVGSAVCAVAALLHNLFLLPLYGGKKLWRSHEAERGASLGIVLYPLTVLILILCFWNRLEVAAAVWGILAFGDGMASLTGMTLGRSPRAKLPWNGGKSWPGSLAYVLFGATGCFVLLQWTAPFFDRGYPLAFALGISLAAALFAAFLESLPQGLDDNFGVPLLTGLFLFCLLLTEGSWPGLFGEAFLPRLLIGGAINLVLAILAHRARSVDLSGAVVGWILGTAIYVGLDWQGFLFLMTFFGIGTACTKLGYKKKAAAGLAQEKGGRRSARHAIANAGVAAACALFAATTPHFGLFALAFVGAFATALSDTTSSEIGQLYGRRTFLITTLKPVPRGTEGAVSLEGTLAGVAASLLVAVLGWVVGFFGPLEIVLVVLAAFIGTTLESLVGATLEKRGLLDNEAVNFLNTLVGALAAVGLLALWHCMVG
jgi:uncharacterized protein (TIGR00297 family)